tara:strand:- start:10355 stop:10474 length:120 start_codon:yes stop_codon:yes gene_type:complete
MSHPRMTDVSRPPEYASTQLGMIASFKKLLNGVIYVILV